MKTIMITGASSGYGLETARYFLERDWRVIATMRTPREDMLPRSPALRVLPLDVTDAASIAGAMAAAGPVDALVNNAGIGVVGAFEATPMDHIRRVFDTNTFGVMAMTQAVIPQMRERRAGVIYDDQCLKITHAKRGAHARNVADPFLNLFGSRLDTRVKSVRGNLRSCTREASRSRSPSLW